MLKKYRSRGLSPGQEAPTPEEGGQLPGFGKASGPRGLLLLHPTATVLPFQLPQRVRARGPRANVRTPTCRVDTSTGPLSCPTRKNSTVTVFLSARRAAPERWVKSGKARARAQAEAKASERSQTTCSTERQSRERGQTRGSDPGEELHSGQRGPAEPPCGGLRGATVQPWEKENISHQMRTASEAGK